MPDLTNPMIMGMIKSMFQGFKINIDLEVVGSIVKTNAEYVERPAHHDARDGHGGAARG